MNNNKFEDILNSFEHGHERYMNLVNSLELILDEASDVFIWRWLSRFQRILKR